MQTREAYGFTWVDRGEDDTDDHLTFSGHEQGMYLMMQAIMPRGATFLDIGAHVGLWSIRMAPLSGNVVALEANPYTFSALKRNWQLNQDKFPDTRFWPFNLAAWDTDSTVELFDWHGKASGGSTECRQSEQGTIKAVPIDSLQLPSDIALIKIDVEGAEARVLRGMEKLLLEQQPKVLVEMHAGIQNVPASVDDEVYSFFDSVNYECGDEFMITGGRHIVAEPKTEDLDGWKVRVDE